MNWSKEKKGLVKRYTFLNQTELAEFVLKLAKMSDELNHHADMNIVFNQLELKLITHDVAQVTDKDWNMAEQIDNL